MGSLHYRRLALGAILLSLFSAAAQGQDQPAKPSADDLEFFEKQIRPLLVERCYECHSSQSDEVEGGLLLDLRDAVRKGGESGPAVAPGDVDKSLLIKAVRYTDPNLQMPPGGKLADREIAALEQWVLRGAPDPREGSATLPPPKPQFDYEQARQFWSFRPVADPPPPVVQDSTWPRDDIDRFILAALEQADMRPAPPADKRALIRRATFDLTGLPPTPEEIDAFLQDDSPDAFRGVVDRLLASPHYGERWGRHWLDVVRYADTSGCNGDFPMPEAYRYRNYVIDSFNRDKPFDRFVREQIAGDLLPSESDEQRYEQTIAAGYLAISRRFSSLGEEFHLTLDDTIDNLGKAILGLSISCARCHAHKFDPIPQEDYYALYGIFQSTTYAFPGTEIYRHMQHMTPLVSAERLQNELRADLDKMEQLDAEIFRIYSEMAEKDTGKEKNDLRSQWKKLEKERDELIKKLPPYDKAYGVREGTAQNARLHLKGDSENLGGEVARGFLQVLGGQTVPADESGSGRMQLAQWLTDPQNPLTARVIVNRIWLHHFGKGIVRTPNDFGERGDAPTHPQLLDYLASRFVADGWSFKKLHRRIMLSQAYQMACAENPNYAQRDPENALLWRFNRRRLDAEEIRDAMLAVSGALDRSPGGPHPFPAEWDWRYSQHNPFVDDFATNRRTVYVMQQRIRQQPFLAVFDGADANAATDKRIASTTPQQALFMMNSEFVYEQAAKFAQRLEAEATSPAERVDRALMLALGRPASEAERNEALDYLGRIGRQLAQAGDQQPDSALQSYLRVLLSSNEFEFVD